MPVPFSVDDSYTIANFSDELIYGTPPLLTTTPSTDPTGQFEFRVLLDDIASTFVDVSGLEIGYDSTGGTIATPKLDNILVCGLQQGRLNLQIQSSALVSGAAVSGTTLLNAPYVQLMDVATGRQLVAMNDFIGFRPLGHPFTAGTEPLNFQFVKQTPAAFVLSHANSYALYCNDKLVVRQTLDVVSHRYVLKLMPTSTAINTILVCHNCKVGQDVYPLPLPYSQIQNIRRPVDSQAHVILSSPTTDSQFSSFPYSGRPYLNTLTESVVYRSYVRIQDEFHDRYLSHGFDGSIDWGDLRGQDGYAMAVVFLLTQSKTAATDAFPNETYYTLSSPILPKTGSTYASNTNVYQASDKVVVRLNHKLLMVGRNSELARTASRMKIDVRNDAFGGIWCHLLPQIATDPLLCFHPRTNRMVLIQDDSYETEFTQDRFLPDMILPPLLPQPLLNGAPASNNTILEGTKDAVLAANSLDVLDPHKSQKVVLFGNMEVQTVGARSSLNSFVASIFDPSISDSALQKLASNQNESNRLQHLEIGLGLTNLYENVNGDHWARRLHTIVVPENTYVTLFSRQNGEGVSYPARIKDTDPTSYTPGVHIMTDLSLVGSAVVKNYLSPELYVISLCYGKNTQTENLLEHFDPAVPATAVTVATPAKLRTGGSASTIYRPQSEPCNGIMLSLCQSMNYYTKMCNCYREDKELGEALSGVKSQAGASSVTDLTETTKGFLVTPTTDGATPTNITADELSKALLSNSNLYTPSICGGPKCKLSGKVGYNNKALTCTINNCIQMNNVLFSALSKNNTQNQSCNIYGADLISKTISTDSSGTTTTSTTPTTTPTASPTSPASSTSPTPASSTSPTPTPSSSATSTTPTPASSTGGSSATTTTKKSNTGLIVGVVIGVLVVGVIIAVIAVTQSSAATRKRLLVKPS